MQYTDLDHLHAPKKVTIDEVETDYQYDANGNLVNDGERVISWNQDNMPTKIVKGDQTVEFFYDANGRRIIKKINEDKTIYVNSSYQKSVINGQENTTKYYFANGKRIAIRHMPFAIRYLHQDHLGSTVLATDLNSEPLGETLSYFPYGNFVNNSVTQLSSNPKYLFTGQEEDPEIGLYNYNARLYNPKTGVFISADTVQGLNRYAYAANNPLRYTDPSGLKIPGETQEEARLRMQQNRRRIEQQKQTQLVLEQNESPVEQILRLGSRLRELVGEGSINSTNIEDIIADIKDEFEWNVLDAIIDSVRQDQNYQDLMGQTEVGNLHCVGFVRSYTRMAGGELPGLGGGSYEVGVDLSSSGFIWHSSDDIQKRAYEVKEGDILSYRSRGKDEGSFSNHLAVITDPNGLLAEAVGGTFRWNGINAGKGGVLVNQRSFDFTSGSATGVPAEQTEGVISWIVGWGVYSMNF